MRQVFGIQSQERYMQSQNISAGLNRDAEIAQAIVGGVSGAAESFMGMAKGAKPIPGSTLTPDEED